MMGRTLAVSPAFLTVDRRHPMVALLHWDRTHHTPSTCASSSLVPVQTPCLAVPSSAHIPFRLCGLSSAIPFYYLLDLFCCGSAIACCYPHRLLPACWIHFTWVPACCRHHSASPNLFYHAYLLCTPSDLHLPALLFSFLLPTFPKFPLTCLLCLPPTATVYSLTTAMLSGGSPSLTFHTAARLPALYHSAMPPNLLPPPHPFPIHASFCTPTYTVSYACSCRGLDTSYHYTVPHLRYFRLPLRAVLPASLPHAVLLPLPAA